MLSPTRELASQINERATAYASYLNLRTAVIFGGVKQNAQTRALREVGNCCLMCIGCAIACCAFLLAASQNCPFIALLLLW